MVYCRGQCAAQIKDFENKVVEVNILEARWGMVAEMSLCGTYQN